MKLLHLLRSLSVGLLVCFLPLLTGQGCFNLAAEPGELEALADDNEARLLATGPARNPDDAVFAGGTDQAFGENPTVLSPSGIGLDQTDGDEDARGQDAATGGGIGSVEDTGAGPVRSGVRCPVVLGTGSDPGDGSGSVILLVRYPEFAGSVTYRPQVPDIGSTNSALGPGVEEVFSFQECPDQIALRDIRFDDGRGTVANAGDVVFARGTDYACGEMLVVTFLLPCQVELDQIDRVDDDDSAGISPVGRSEK